MKKFIITLGTIFVLLSILAITVVSCEDDYSFECPNNSKTNIQYDSIQISKVELSDFETCTFGITEVVGDKIYFADKQFKTVHEFDTDGKLIRKVLGAGRSRREHSSIIEHFYYSPEKGCFIILDNGNQLYTYDLDSVGMIIRETKSFYKKGGALYSNMAEKSESYSVLYDKLRFRDYEGMLYMSVAGNHPLFNMFIPGYFSDARIIRGVSLKKGDNTTIILGRMSPETHEHQSRKQFFMFDFDLDEDGTFFVNYELDSLIYKLDTKGDVIGSFGNEGRDLDFDEHSNLSQDQYRDEYTDERKYKSYYKMIRKIGDYTFRTYQKRMNSTTDGLQIYDGEILVADVDVPKGIDVVNRIGDYYYSAVMYDDTSEKSYVYKFKF